MKENILKFEHVVVVPVYNEEIEDVLRLLHSIAIQQSSFGLSKRRALVFNINNSEAESREPNNLVYKNNLAVFAFLQGLVKTDADISKYYQDGQNSSIEDMIGVVRNSLTSGDIYIELIDSFSPNHARAHNTLGFARELATRSAVNNLVKDENSLLFSTDADCIFATETMSEADKMFASQKIDLAPLNMDYHFYNLDQKSCQSAVRYRLSRLLVENLISLSTTFSTHSRPKVANSILLKKAFNVGGAFTVIRAGKYKNSRGYPDDFKEDLYIIASIREAGGIIGDFRKLYPKAVVYTSPRVSERVPVGYGTKIASFSRDERDFFRYKVTDIDAHLDVVSCVREIEEEIENGQCINPEVILRIVESRCSWMDESIKDAFINDLNDVFSNNPFAFYNDAHWNLSNKTKRLLRNRLLPQQTIRDQVERLESIYSELGVYLFQGEEEALRDDSTKEFLDYKSFKNYLFDKIKFLPNLDMDEVFSVATCSVANYYLQLYIPEFKEWAMNDKYHSSIDTLLGECEARLLEAIVYGYKGELNLETEESIFERLNFLRN